MLRGRAVPVALLVAFAGLVLALLSMPFMARDRPPLLQAAEPLFFRGAIGELDVQTGLALSPEGVLAIDLRLVARDGTPLGGPPRLALSMPEHAMPALRPGVRALGAGRFEASAALPMAGHWELLIEAADGRFAAPFRVPP